MRSTASAARTNSRSRTVVVPAVAGASCQCAEMTRMARGSGMAAAHRVELPPLPGSMASVGAP
ncbi:MAG: hypothetical protein ACOC9W_03265, partial [Persicimonas sp.]